jgi:1,4-dihydroxy-2-naphthoate octaprenyltransferase
MARSSVHIWWLAARPKTLPAAVAPVLIGTSIALADGAFHWPAALAAALGALLIQIGTNLANDYFDFKNGADTAERLGPVRVTQAGLVTPAQTKAATAVAFGLALLVGGYLVYRGGWPIVTIGLLSILFGVLYTGGPYPLGYNGLGDSFVLIFFGPIAVAGTHYVQTLTWSLEAAIAGFAPGCFSVAILTVNNLRDLDNDNRAGKRTLPVRFGRRFAMVEYIAMLLLACSLPAVMVLVFEASRWTLLAALTLLPAVSAIRAVATVTGRELNDTLAATGRLLLVFSLLFSIGWLL